MTATPETVTGEQPLDPSALEARCPICDTALWAERGGAWTLKCRILRCHGGAFTAVCPEQGCRGEVPVPWMMVNPDPNSHRARPRRRYILRPLDTATGGEPT
jgi:hypothetical protein